MIPAAAMAGFGRFLTGGGGMMIAIGLAGAAVGGWFGASWQRGEFKELAEEAVSAQGSNAVSLVTLVQNAGRREMNYLWRQQAERDQCRATIETFNGWDKLGAKERAAASERARRLADEIATAGQRYEELKKSYESSDATVAEWLNTRLPADLCIVRYGDEACRADPFAAAGYPEPPDPPGAVAKSAGR